MYGDKAIICLASCDIKEIYYLNTADYHNIDGLYIIDEKTVDELNNGPFDVELLGDQIWGSKNIIILKIPGLYRKKFLAKMKAYYITRFYLSGNQKAMTEQKI